MLEHLTLDPGAYAMQMHVRALAPGCLIDVDPDTYAAELALKAEVLASDYGYYYQALPGTDDVQWETLEVVLPNMAAFYPRWFRLDRERDRWRWTNRLLGTVTAFTLGEPATLPLPPLDWVGRQVQEDLCIMDGTVPETPLIAGHLCFGSGWCLNDKMGASFLAIHAPVPGFADSIGRSAELMMQRLRVDRPAARVNWTIHPSDHLNCAPALKRQYAFEHTGLTAANAGERFFLRSEWQTFARYPRTRAVLFTIRTRVRPLAEAVTCAEDARRLATLLRSMPPTLLDYKSLTNHVGALLGWLDARLAAAEPHLT